MEVIKGIPVSPGVVIGRAFVLDDPVRHIPYRTVPQEDVNRQRGRLLVAIERAILDLEQDLRVIAPSYPDVTSLHELATGIDDIAKYEGVESYSVLGQSAGGIVAQVFRGHALQKGFLRQYSFPVFTIKA